MKLVDIVDEGIRPVVASDKPCGPNCQCLKVCPAISTNFAPGQDAASRDQFTREWGTVLEVWEGHAADSEIRFQGSSGGALTAISAYCLEKAGMHGVLHIGADEKDPSRNRTRLSRNRSELMATTGSRYSPASVCNRLDWVENAPAPCVVIGKPVEIAAVSNARSLRPKLNSNIGVTLSFFCAETPSTRGTWALLKKMGVERDTLSELRYRGRGWPGHFAPVSKGETAARAKLTYRESWGFLQAFRPWAVQLWPDSTGELADITCGDPWYEQPDGQNPGFSLIVVRTERGREILRGAIEAGYLQATPAERWKLEKSQKGLLLKKGAVWGRRLALRSLGLPVTEFKGLDLFGCWRKLSFSEKLRSTLGTLRRVFTRGIYRRAQFSQSERLPVS